MCNVKPASKVKTQRVEEENTHTEQSTWKSSLIYRFPLWECLRIKRGVKIKISVFLFQCPTHPQRLATSVLLCSLLFLKKIWFNQCQTLVLSASPATPPPTVSRIFIPLFHLRHFFSCQVSPKLLYMSHSSRCCPECAWRQSLIGGGEIMKGSQGEKTELGVSAKQVFCKYTLGSNIKSDIVSKSLNSHGSKIKSW